MNIVATSPNVWRSNTSPAEEPAVIKAQIAQKEEEIDQLRQTVAGLRRRLEELEDDGRERNQAG